MKITRLELSAKDLLIQKEYYSEILGLTVKTSASELKVQVGETELVFIQSDSDFDGAYHFAFNIPANQFSEAKTWIASRQPLLRDVEGKDEFVSKTWNSNPSISRMQRGMCLNLSHGMPCRMRLPGYSMRVKS